MEGRNTLIEVDWSTFDPWRVHQVRHRLANHPLLELDRLVELGKRLEASGRVRSHSNDAAAGTPFNEAPKLHPNARSAEETLRAFAEAKAFTSLLNVQTDPEYRALIDAVLDPLKPQIDRVDPGMSFRAGWIFVTSPHTTTPFHIDKEHNFLLQIRGRKTVYVWEPDDEVVVSERARDRFHALHDRDLIVWKEEFRERAHKLVLEPGQGAYMPSTAPHLVETMDEPTITMSFTYYTDSTRRDSLLHRTHERLRGLGIEPPKVGHRPILDGVTHAGASALVRAKEAMRALRGRPVGSDRVPYGHANVY
jgi:hypothetical protein